MHMRKHNDISIDSTRKEVKPKIQAMGSAMIRGSKRTIKEPQFEESIKYPLPALSTTKSKVKKKEYGIEEDKWSDTDGLSFSVAEEKSERVQLPDSDLVAIELSNLISGKNGLKNPQNPQNLPSPVALPNLCPPSCPFPLTQATTDPKSNPSPEDITKKEF